MRKFVSAVIVAAILVTGAFAQTKTATKPKSAGTSPITSEQADAILSELRRIRELLEKRDSSDSIASELRAMRMVMERQQNAPQQAAAAPAPAAPQHVKFTLGDNFALGSRTAPVVLVEFSDYQCPFCRAFHNGAYPEIKKNLVDTGKVRFISRDLPLEMHNNATKAAQAAHCAGEQNKFWEMRDTLINNAANLAPDAITGFAKSLGLDMTRFQSCMADNRFLNLIQADANGATSLGISGTPTFVIGKMNGDQLEGTIVVGAQPYSFYEAQVNQLLAK